MHGQQFLVQWFYAIMLSSVGHRYLGYRWACRTTYSVNFYATYPLKWPTVCEAVTRLCRAALAGVISRSTDQFGNNDTATSGDGDGDG